MTFGYIKVLKSEYNEIIQKYGDGYLISLNIENTNKLIKYYLFNALVDKNTNQNIIQIYNDLTELKNSFENNFLIPFENNGIINYYRDISLITEQLDYNWTDKIILNNKTYTVYNYKQCFVNTEFFKQIRRK